MASADRHFKTFPAIRGAFRGFSAGVPWAELAGLAVAVGLASGPAQAHHSYAMFDKTKTRVLKGTVSSFQRVNPHGYLDLEVPTKSGRAQVWSIELQSTLAMEKQKVNQDTFKPGQPVTITINPLRNGTTGGSFVSAVLPSGEVVGIVPD